MSYRDQFTTPILPGTAASDYERYLRTDELLALQKSPADLLHKDEMTFIVVHQASELLMKGAAFELDRALEYLEKADYGNSSRLIRRANQMVEPAIGLLTFWKPSRPMTITSFARGLGMAVGSTLRDSLRCCTLARASETPLTSSCNVPG